LNHYAAIRVQAAKQKSCSAIDSYTPADEDSAFRYCSNAAVDVTDAHW
jgi:hypothetical protein